MLCTTAVVHNGAKKFHTLFRKTRSPQTRAPSGAAAFSTVSTAPTTTAIKVYSLWAERGEREWGEGNGECGIKNEELNGGDVKQAPLSKGAGCGASRRLGDCPPVACLSREPQFKAEQSFRHAAYLNRHLAARQSLRHGLRPCHLPLTREAERLRPGSVLLAREAKQLI